MRQRALFNQVLNDPKENFLGLIKEQKKIISKQFNNLLKKN